MIFELPLLLKLFLVSFFINLFWEVRHSQLYETCLKKRVKPYINLITKMSLLDSFWIVLFYYITTLIFNNTLILQNLYQFLLFVGLTLSFAFADEKVALRINRWKYSKKMPRIFGVGITPLSELGLTGIISFLIIF